jgi:hypothetical protein
LADKPISDMVALEITSNWRATALVETLIALVIAALGAVFLGRWQRDAGTGRRRAELLIVAVIVLDVLASFWKSARVISPRAMSTRVAWPQSLTAQYDPSQALDARTFTGTPFNGTCRLAFTLSMATMHWWPPVLTEFISEVEGREIWRDVSAVCRFILCARVAGVTALLSFNRQPRTQFHSRTMLFPRCAKRRLETVALRRRGGRAFI